MLATSLCLNVKRENSDLKFRDWDCWQALLKDEVQSATYQVPRVRIKVMMFYSTDVREGQYCRIV